MSAPEDFSKQVNELPGDSWVKRMGIHITLATTEEVRCELEIDERHHQGYGIVHGGVHCGVIETIASVGAHLVAMSRNQRAVGLENSTSFIRAVRGGKLTGVARPVTRGRTSQVWEAQLFDADQKLVAKGSVRLLCINEGEPLAGRG